MALVLSGFKLNLWATNPSRKLALALSPRPVRLAVGGERRDGVVHAQGAAQAPVRRPLSRFGTYTREIGVQARSGGSAAAAASWSELLA